MLSIPQPETLDGFYGHAPTLGGGGRWSVEVGTEPAVEPVTTAEAKANSRVEHTQLDAEFAAWITAARQMVEEKTRRALITQTRKLRLDRFPNGAYIELPAPPLQSVTSITYLDRDGNNQTLDSGTYNVDVYGLVGNVRMKEDQVWPATQSGTPNVVTVEYIAGYGDAGSDVPQALRTAILYLVNHYFEQPSMVVTGSIATEIEGTFNALLQPYKIPNLF